MFLFLLLNFEIFLVQTTSMDFHGWDFIAQVTTHDKRDLPLVQFEEDLREYGRL